MIQYLLDLVWLKLARRRLDQLEPARLAPARQDWAERLKDQVDSRAQTS